MMMKYVLSILLALALCLPSIALADGGVGDGSISPDAAVSAYKLKLFYPNSSTFTTARSASYARSGKRDAGLLAGTTYFDSTSHAWKYWTGATWSLAGDVTSFTLDEAYTAGQTIDRDLGTLAISDAKVDALATMSLTRTAGTGALLTLANSASVPGNDLTGAHWSVTHAGKGSITGLSVTDPLEGSAASVSITKPVGVGPLLSFTGPASDGTDVRGTSNLWSFSTAGYLAAAGVQVGPSSRAVSITPISAAGNQIEYLTVKPVQHVFIPAGSFGVGATGSSTWGKQDNAAGWTLDAASTECVQTTWQPDLWVDTGVNVSGYAIFAAPAAGDVVLALSRVSIVSGTTATTLSDSSPGTLTTATLEKKISKTAAFTIAYGLLSTTLGQPLYIEVCRMGGETADTMSGDLVFMGLDLEVTRKYGD